MLITFIGRFRAALAARPHSSSSAFRRVELKNGCRLDEQRVALRRALTECRRATLIGQLQGSEGRQIPIHHSLNVVAIDGGVGLQEQPQEEICPPTSHLTAFAWSVCDRMPCPSSQL